MTIQSPHRLNRAPLKDVPTMLEQIAERTRNPVLSLPACKELVMLDPAARAALVAVLRNLSVQAKEQAEKDWRRSKAPMAAYWKAVGTYSWHTARAVEAAGEAARRLEQIVADHAAV